MLIDLHWLPVECRIMILMTFKALHGLAQPCLSDMLSDKVHFSYNLRCNHSNMVVRPAIRSARTTGATFHLLESFSLSSGLRINYKKTEALWIGSCVGKEENLLPEKNIQWNESKVKFLGVWLSTDPKITLRTNYDEKLEKIRIVLNSWKLRRLTLIGKIVVLKSLAASHLPYILAPLETDERFLKEINQIFYDFLWNNKGDKIKRSVLINSYDKGGSK